MELIQSTGWTGVRVATHFLYACYPGGTARFIALSRLLLQPHPPKLLLIDEPELRLHPFAIAVIVDMVKFASRIAQLIISTQSIQLLNEFGLEPEENGLKILIVENLSGATTITTPIIGDVGRLDGGIQHRRPLADEYSRGNSVIAASEDIHVEGFT